MIRVRNSEASIRQNKFGSSPQYAIWGEYYATLLVESNEMSKDRMICLLKDNSSMNFFNNKVTGTIRPVVKDQRLQRVKALNVTSFSTATIEGNIINGDYDYAVYIDGQSNVDCRANQYQLGKNGGIYYSGVSSGLCEDNQYTGQAIPGRDEPYFGRGCIRKRKQQE